MKTEYLIIYAACIYKNQKTQSDLYVQGASLKISTGLSCTLVSEVALQ